MIGFWIFLSVLLVCETWLRVTGKASILSTLKNRVDRSNNNSAQGFGSSADKPHSKPPTAAEQVHANQSQSKPKPTVPPKHPNAH